MEQNCSPGLVLIDLSGTGPMALKAFNNSQTNTFIFSSRDNEGLSFTQPEPTEKRILVPVDQ